MELTVRTWMDGGLTNHWCLTDEERPVSSDLVDYLYCFTMIDHERWVMARGETEIGPPIELRVYQGHHAFGADIPATLLIAERWERIWERRLPTQAELIAENSKYLLVAIAAGATQFGDEANPAADCGRSARGQEK